MYYIDVHMPNGYDGSMKGNKDSMVRTALFVKSGQMAKLQTLSQVTGAPVAELVRRAIDAYLEQRKAEIKNV
jgi:predicted DNA-binding protein